MHTYSRLYIHTVFSVKNRAELISAEWETNLHKIIGSTLKEIGCTPIITNGTADHIHCFYVLLPSINISETMKMVKGRSSRWINKNHVFESKFRWQRGFAAFSVNANDYKNMYYYIKNQKEKHLKITMKQELELLNQTAR